MSCYLSKDPERGDVLQKKGLRNVGSHSGKQYGGFLKKLKTELPHDPIIALPGIYPKNTKKTEIYLKRYTHVYVYCSSIIYNSQNMETSPSAHHWMND